MLNRQRYESIRHIFSELGVKLPDSDIALYADMFEVIAQYTHGKLDDRDMVTSFDFLSDLITGRRSDYAVIVRKDDRIKLQIRCMEELPETVGKLTDDEKEKFAFCVYYATCVQKYDEIRRQPVSALVDFTSVEAIEAEYRNMRRLKPEMFTADASSVSPTGRFAFSKDNPVQATSVQMAYTYLHRLRHNGNPIEYTRISSTKADNGHIVDVYSVKTKKASLFGKSESFTLYIDAYCSANSSSAPEGFTLS